MGCGKNNTLLGLDGNNNFGAVVYLVLLAIRNNYVTCMWVWLIIEWNDGIAYDLGIGG